MIQSAIIGSNTANFDNCADWNGQDGNVTSVGTNGGPSAYGTYDMAGNAWEWIEDAVGSNNRVLRGGNYGYDINYLSSVSRSHTANSIRNNYIGFRIAAIDSSFLDINIMSLVGDENNNADISGFGSVNYIYYIGKYEITNSQYVEFLNSVAQTDTNGLYINNMGFSPYGGINRSGTVGSLTYSVKPNMTNKPVNFVNWTSCARYCNWLHNDKPNGLQDIHTTENGAYDLTQSTISRNVNAKFFIPNENEWYKAAYYKSAGTNTDYWLYATQSDIAPSCVNADVVGDGPIVNMITPTPTATSPETPTPTPTATSPETPTPTPTATSPETPTPTPTATSPETPTPTPTETQINTLCDVLLKMNMDGQDGSASFIDESKYNRSISLIGSSPIIKTNNKKFGSGSAYFANGQTSSAIRINSLQTIVGDTEDFTIEFWIYLESSNWNSNSIIGNWGFSNGSFGDWSLGARVNQFGQIYFDAVTISTSSGLQNFITNNTIISIGQWYHIAFARKSGISKLYVNGLSGNSINDIIYRLGKTNASTDIGFNNSNYFKGYIDEIKIIKGLSLYDSDFAVPAERLADCQVIEPTPSPTPTTTQTATPTSSITATITSTPTITSTNTVTPTITPTNSGTSAATATPTPTRTVTPTNTRTSAATPTPTPTNTRTSIVLSTPTPTATNWSNRSCDKKIIKVYIPNSILSPGGIRSSSVQLRIGGGNCCGFSNIVNIPVPPLPPPLPTPVPDDCLPQGLDLYGYTAIVSYDPDKCGGGHVCNRAIFDLYLNSILIGRANLNNGNDGGYRESVFTINEHITTDPAMTVELRCVLDNCHRGIGRITIKGPSGNTVFSACLPNDTVVFAYSIVCNETPTPTPSNTPQPTPTPTPTAEPTPTPAPTSTPIAIICDKIPAIQICNSNSARDDNFNVYLNNSYIGFLDLNQEDQVGSIFIGNDTENYTISETATICPINNMTVYNFPLSLISVGNNTLYLENVQQNGNGNYGLIQIRNYAISGSSLTNPSFIADLEYSGGDGDNFTLNFAYNECGEFIQTYVCDSINGCSNRLDGLGSINCDGCLERYTCDPLNGCQSIGYGETGMTQSECESTCIVQSYDCDPTSGCIPRYDNLGSLQNCTECLQRYECNTYFGCQPIGFALSGITQATCNQSCSIQSYECNFWEGCVPRYDNLGSLANCNDCEMRYSCDSLNGCSWMGYSTSGMNQIACESSCSILSYDCDPNAGCIPRYDNLGSLQDCTTCLERYSCDSFMGCTNIGYYTSGNILTQCSQDCTVKSYDCEPWTGCVSRYDTSGALTNCLNCQMSFSCYENYIDDQNYSYCAPSGFTANNPVGSGTCCSTEPCLSSIITLNNNCPNIFW